MLPLVLVSHWVGAWFGESIAVLFVGGVGTFHVWTSARSIAAVNADLAELTYRRTS